MMLGRPPQLVSEIIRGKKRITERTALELAEVFGTSPELWLNWKAGIAPPSPREATTAICPTQASFHLSWPSVR